MSEERSKFQIKCVEKATLPNTFKTCPMRLSTLAVEVVNPLFKVYKDYAGCKVEGVQAFGNVGLPIITCELYFTDNPTIGEDDTRAFKLIKTAKDTGIEMAGPIAHMQAIDAFYRKSKKYELTEDGTDGITPFVMYNMQQQNVWTKRCVSEIVDKDTYGHQQVFARVINIDIIKCIEEFCGTKMVEDGVEHRLMYGIEMKRPLSNGANGGQADWLVEVVTGDIDNFESLAKDLGMCFSAQSSLNITRV